MNGKTRPREEKQVGRNQISVRVKRFFIPLNRAGMTKFIIPAKNLLFGSLAIMVTINTCRDCRPMTLRHQVSLVLPFGQPVGLDQRAPDFRCLALRHRLSAGWLLSAVWRSWLSSALDP